MGAESRTISGWGGDESWTWRSRGEGREGENLPTVQGVLSFSSLQSSKEVDEREGVCRVIWGFVSTSPPGVRWFMGVSSRQSSQSGEGTFRESFLTATTEVS